MTSYYQLLRVNSLLTTYIEKELGGTVVFIDNKDEKGEILRWKKYDPKTKKQLHFNHKISYEEIEAVKEPFTFAEGIIEKYRKGLKNG